jgi:hypothetical protein
MIFQHCRRCGQKNQLMVPGYYRLGMQEEIDIVLKDVVEKHGRCRKCGGPVRLIEDGGEKNAR